MEKREARTGYFFIAPFFVIYGLFGLFPLLFTLYLSLTTWNGIGSMQFVGLDNYVRIFTQQTYFWKSITNVLIIMAGYLPLLLLLGLALAALIHGKFIRRKSFFQLSLFLPYLTTPVAIGFIFSLLFDYSIGTVNQMLGTLGIPAVHWLDRPETARVVVCLMLVWKWLGYCITFYLAGMNNIDECLYEAAEIDGANEKQKFFFVTVPMIRPVLSFLIITGIIGAMQVFEEPKLLFAGATFASRSVGGPQYSVLTPVWYLYDLAFTKQQYGFGSTVSIMLFLIIVVFSMIFYRFLTKGGKGDA